MSAKIIKDKKDQVPTAIVECDEPFNFPDYLAALVCARFTSNLPTFPVFISDALLLPVNCLRRSDFTTKALMGYLHSVQVFKRMPGNRCDHGFFTAAHIRSITAQVHVGHAMSMLVAMSDDSAKLLMDDLYKGHCADLADSAVAAFTNIADMVETTDLAAKS